MAWEVLVFETRRGDKPVEEFIQSLQPQTVSKILHNINLLENYGNRLGIPHSKRLEGEIFELRVRGKQEIRILYILVDKQIYLLHAFKKQTQTAPKKEIEVALERVKVINLQK